MLADLVLMMPAVVTTLGAYHVDNTMPTVRTCYRTTFAPKYTYKPIVCRRQRFQAVSRSVKPVLGIDLGTQA